MKEESKPADSIKILKKGTEKNIKNKSIRKAELFSDGFGSS